VSRVTYTDHRKKMKGTASMDWLKKIYFLPYNETSSLLPSPPSNNKYTHFTTENTINLKPLILMTMIKSVSIMTSQCNAHEQEPVFCMVPAFFNSKFTMIL
jgi:hypothetical protein